MPLVSPIPHWAIHPIVSKAARLTSTYASSRINRRSSGPSMLKHSEAAYSKASKISTPFQLSLIRKILEDDRTYGPAAIAQLCKLKEWSGSWTTLRVHKDKKIWCETDVSPPHTVPKQYLLDQYPVCDISSLSVNHEAKSRVSEVLHDGQISFLKIARFPRELPWLIQEIQAYHALAGSAFAPKLLNYVSESSPDRVVGFLVEKLVGRTAELVDLEPCGQALDQLHDHLIHGDLCKYNIFITSKGPRFIDFENSILVGTEHWTVTSRDEEKRILAEKLADTSGEGQPW